MVSNVKIKGVIFARAWYTAAVSTMERGDRLNYYDTIFAYAFEGKEPANVSPVVRTAFAMVREFIDQDIIKYQERCERNRQNARGGKRVAASGSESLRVADNTNTNTNNTTNTNNNTISLSEEREKFLICGSFFARGALQPAEELKRFWEYYDSLGWRNNKGAQIVKKTAAARMWNLQTGITKQALAPRVAWFEAMSRCECSNIVIFDSLVRADVRGDVLHLIARDVKTFSDICEHQFMAGLKTYATGYECRSAVYEPALQD